MTFISPADTLSALELLAIGEEKEHRYAPQTQRTVEHVMERLTLHVGARYEDEVEDRLILWTTATFAKAYAGRKLPVHIVYYCDWAGYRFRLSNDGATQILTLGDLPEDMKVHLRNRDGDVAVRVALDRDDAALFASLNRGTPSPYVDRPPQTPRRRSTTRLLPALPHAEAVERMKEMERS